MAANPLQKLYDGFSDHPRFCRECCTIRDKNGATLRFVLQPAQIKLHNLVREIRAQARPVRIIALKARQVMVSTAVAGEYFHTVGFVPGQHALIVAHEEKAAKNIFGYYQQLHRSYQPFGGVIQRLDEEFCREASGEIEYAGGGWIHVSTANNVKTGRSFSIRLLHLSEYAFYRDARTLCTGLLQSVPDDPDTMVVIESTANGVGGDFYQKWQEANDPSSGSEWRPFFFAWWEHPEYSRPIADKAAFQASLTKEEQELKTRFNLRLEQLHWRRWAIRNKCQNSPDVFKQEYPSFPEEAFLFSGRPRFSHVSLSKMPAARRSHEEAREAGIVGELVEEVDGPKPRIIFEPDPERRGALTLYKRPQPGRLYSFGIDVAEGIDANEDQLGNADPDYSVACVLDLDTGEQVAKLRGRIEPAPFAEYIDVLARWYGHLRDAQHLDPRTSSFLVPEANGPGIALLEALLRLGYPPFMIYHRQRSPEAQFSSGDSTELQLLGWRTTAVTRVQLISFLDQCIRERSILVNDPNTLLELQHFVTKANGKAEAVDGGHDDEVIAAALAMKGIQAWPKDERLKLIERGKTPLVANAHATIRRYGKRRLPGVNEQRGELVRW